MADLPGIKGSFLPPIVEDVRKLLADGRLTSAELARRVPADALALLDAEIDVGAWYDIRIYARLCELLRDTEGGGKDTYLRVRGSRNARRLLDAGLYTQLEYLRDIGWSSDQPRELRFEAFGRDLALLTTLSKSALNFSVWSAKPDPKAALRYVIEITEAADFPDALCWTSDGFVNEMARQHNAPDLWTWTRLTHDRILYRMTRDA